MQQSPLFTHHITVLCLAILHNQNIWLLKAAVLRCSLLKIWKHTCTEDLGSRTSVVFVERHSLSKNTTKDTSMCIIMSKRTSALTVPKSMHTKLVSGCIWIVLVPRTDRNELQFTRKCTSSVGLVFWKFLSRWFVIAVLQFHWKGVARELEMTRSFAQVVVGFQVFVDGGKFTCQLLCFSRISRQRPTCCWVSPDCWEHSRQM